MRSRLLRHLRSLFRLQPGKPALWLGVRAAVAVTVPFAIVSSLGSSAAGFTGLTGLLVTLCDRGGSYRGRARVMGRLAVLGPIVGTLAAVAGDALWMDAALLLVGVLVFAFFRSYGDDAASVGDKLAVIFVASLGAAAVPWEGALERGAALLFGAGWAMVQSLVVWPMHPYLPARKALARLYATFAEAADELAELSRTATSAEQWEEASQRQAGPLRIEIEAGRNSLAAARVGLGSEARRFEHLLVILEQGEPMSAALSALAEAMEAASARPALSEVRHDVDDLCRRYARLMRVISAIVREGGTRRISDPDLAVLADPLRAPDEVERKLPRPVMELLNRLRIHANAARDAAEALLQGNEVPQHATRVPLPQNGRRTLLHPIRENLHPRSLVLRHAVRAAFIASLALVIARSLGISQAHWVVLAAISVLQPYSVNTEHLALHRVGGTLVGGTIAATLSAGVQSQAQLLVIIGLLTAISVSLLPLNFAAFQMLLTPDFLLLSSMRLGDWSIAGERAVGVVIACGLALLGVWLLWPSPERRLFPQTAAAVLRADGRYLRCVAVHRSATRPEVGEARRDLGLALIAAEASLQRLVAEYRGPAHRLEPAMALLTYSRRFAGSVTALGEQPGTSRATDGWGEVIEGACGTLDALAQSLEAGERLPEPDALPVPPRNWRPGDPVTEALVERVPRQLRVLRGAVERLTDGDSFGSGPVPVKPHRRRNPTGPLGWRTARTS